MTTAVRARGLVKHYDGVTAVDGIDLDVVVGTSFGLLGPNGAGKTTTMKMVTAVLPPSDGTLEVLGRDVAQAPRRLKRRIGVVPQGVTLDFDLRVRENLVVHARYHGLSRQAAAERADHLLAFAQLSHRSDADIDELSGGMQRRLLIARALVNDPELIILDEPTTGLDPQARHLVWERLRGLRREGRTLVLTTHYMEEAARLCDALAVMHEGRIIARGAPNALVREHVPPRVVELQDAVDVDESGLRTAVGGAARDIERVGDRLVVYGDDSQAMVESIRTTAPGHALLVRDATLEDLFLRLTGHALVD